MNTKIYAINSLHPGRRNFLLSVSAKKSIALSSVHFFLNSQKFKVTQYLYRTRKDLL